MATRWNGPIMDGHARVRRCQSKRGALRNAQSVPTNDVPRDLPSSALRLEDDRPRRERRRRETVLSQQSLIDLSRSL